MGKYKAKKTSLSYQENIKSWKSGVKTKIVNVASRPMQKTMRNGLILT